MLSYGVKMFKKTIILICFLVALGSRLAQSASTSVWNIVQVNTNTGVVTPTDSAPYQFPTSSFARAYKTGTNAPTADDFVTQDEVDDMVADWSLYPAFGAVDFGQTGDQDCYLQIKTDTARMLLGPSYIENGIFGPGVIMAATNHSDSAQRSKIMIAGGGVDVGAGVVHTGAVYFAVDGAYEYLYNGGTTGWVAKIDGSGNWDFMAHALYGVSSITAGTGRYNAIDVIGGNLTATNPGNLLLGTTNWVLTTAYGNINAGIVGTTASMATAYGCIRAGYFTGTTNGITASYGALQMGYNNGGSLIMGSGSHGSAQLVYINGTGTVSIAGNNCYGSAQFGYNTNGREIIGFLGRGAVQIFDNTGGIATNLGAGALQIHSLASSDLARTTATGDGSLLIGVGVSSNKHCLVIGGSSTTESHGDGSFTASGDAWVGGKLVASTNYSFFISSTNWAGTWADYAGTYHGINSNGTIRIITNLWAW